MATRHSFAAHAALIPLLHAARYPSETILGCLLGPEDRSASAGEIRYEHAIPLLHHWTGLSPALEMAMPFVEEYCSMKNWTILGFYFANEGLGEASLDPTKVHIPILVKRLMAQAGASTYFFALDNRHLSSPERAFVPLASSSASGTVSYETPGGSPSALSALIKAGQHKLVDDWDAHLEDIGARWLGNEAVELSASSNASGDANVAKSVDEPSVQGVKSQ